MQIIEKKRMRKQSPRPETPVEEVKQPKKLSKVQQIQKMKEDIRLKKEEDHKFYLQEEEKQRELLEQIIKKCKNEPWDTVSDSDEEDQKIDLSRFRNAYVSIKIKNDIQSNMEDNRKRKLDHEKQQTMQITQIQPIKKKKERIIDGMTVAELHEKMKQEKEEKKQTKIRHLKRAFAGIDRTQI